MSSLYNCYIALLYITDEAIKQLVDEYNAGDLDGTYWKPALEIIDGLPLED